MRGSKIYASKVDTWLVLVVVGIGLALAGGTAWQVAAMGLAHLASWVLLLSLLFYVVVIFGLAYPVAYEIRSPYLIIRAGWTRSRIDLSAIVAVKPTREAASAPALSVDRLRIDYRVAGGNESQLVSPADRAAFLADLAQAMGALEHHPDGRVRDDENTGAAPARDSGSS